MNEPQNQKLVDVFHEFLIMFVLACGVALPIIIINAMNLFAGFYLPLGDMHLAFGG